MGHGLSNLDTITRPLRIAFLTPEFVTDKSACGGLASYVERITMALRAIGHEPEVFAIAQSPTVYDHKGVRVEHVTPSHNLAMWLLSRHWRGRLKLSGTLKQHRDALGLAQALKRRHGDAPFDVLQTSDWGIGGYYVPKVPGRVHLMRCSWSRELYERHAGHESTIDNRMLKRCEWACMRRADIAYAPSRFIAEHLTQRTGVAVQVVRPPMLTAPPPRKLAREDLPPRYMIHFGQLSDIKGTDVLAAALPMVWRQEPTFAMVWAGRESSVGMVQRFAAQWRPHERQVRYIGAVTRERLFSIVRKAEAAVAPSRCDNLPNTVIESLSLGVPVVGSDGASINELVTDGRNGRLAPIGNPQRLAEVLVDLWRNPMTTIDNRDLFKTMRSDAAADAWVRLVRPVTQELATAA